MIASPAHRVESRSFTCKIKSHYRRTRPELFPVLSRIQKIGYDMGETGWGSSMSRPHPCGARDSCSTLGYSAATETRKPSVRWRLSGGPALRLEDRKPLAQLNQPPPRYTRSSPVAGPLGSLVGDVA